MTFQPPSLPALDALFSGQASVKPLLYTADQLQAWFAQLRVARPHAEVLALLQQNLADPAWCRQHDAAHHALIDAVGKVTDADRPALETLMRSQAPNSSSLRMIRDEGLRASLQPLETHLQEGSLSQWTRLTPRQLNAASATAASISPPRVSATNELNESSTPPKPSAEIPSSASRPTSAEEPSRWRLWRGGCGPDCGHESHAAPAATNSTSTSKNKPGRNWGKWGWGVGGAVALSAGIYAATHQDASDGQYRNREAKKTDGEKAIDTAYTLNHALSCATTDMLIAPTISALFGVKVGCSNPAHNHASRTGWRGFGHEALHYFKGEVFGDITAVPMALTTQRFFPGFMHGLSKLVEPIASPFFHYGARKAAEREGKKQGFAADSAQVVARAEEIYRHEMDALPMGIMWNAYAFPMGVIGQKWGGHESDVSRICRNKALGALISNGLLLGMRAIAPDKAEAVDRWNRDHVIEPISNGIQSLFGSRPQTHIPHPAAGEWQDRLATPAVARSA